MKAWGYKLKFIREAAETCIFLTCGNWGLTKIIFYIYTYCFLLKGLYQGKFGARAIPKGYRYPVNLSHSRSLLGRAYTKVCWVCWELWKQIMFLRTADRKKIRVRLSCKSEAVWTACSSDQRTSAGSAESSAGAAESSALSPLLLAPR